MRKIAFLPALLVLVIASCDDKVSADKVAATDSPATASAAAKVDSMNHMTNSSDAIAALPDIPAGAKVFFKNLKNGQTIKSPYKIEFGVQGIALDSAGKLRPASGHHHLLIDAGDSLTAGTVVPKDSTHLHFGNAQKEVEVKLAPGTHRLTLQYADGIHRSYGGKLAASVTVTVKQ